MYVFGTKMTKKIPNLDICAAWEEIKHTYRKIHAPNPHHFVMVKNANSAIMYVCCLKPFCIFYSGIAKNISSEMNLIVSERKICSTRSKNVEYLPIVRNQATFLISEIRQRNLWGLIKLNH